jgi:DNA-binding transcriptional LysR family regulator
VEAEVAAEHNRHAGRASIVRNRTSEISSLVKSFALAEMGVAILPRRVARYWQERRLRRLHPALPFIADEIHLLFRGDAHRTRAFVTTKNAIVAHGRALDGDYGK